MRDPVLRERGRELRGRDAPHLRGVRAEEEPVERPAHCLYDPVLGRHELARAHAAAQRLDGVVGERAGGEHGRHRLRDVERLERVLVVLAAELYAHVLRLRGEAVGRDLLEHVEDPLIASVVRVRSEVVARAGLAAQCRRETAEEVLGFEQRDPLTVLRE